MGTMSQATLSRRLNEQNRQTIANGLNGARVVRPIDPTKNTFVVLPSGVWRSAGRCDCRFCKGEEGFWDTLAIPPTGTAYTVHYPELQTSFKTTY